MTPGVTWLRGGPGRVLGELLGTPESHRTTGRSIRRVTLAALPSKRFTPSPVAAGSRMIDMLETRRRQPLKVILKCDFPAEIR